MYDLQKASMWKRISALLCDFIVLSVVVVGMAFVMSTVLGYDTRAAQLENLSEAYEKEYNVDFDISDKEYQALPEDVHTRYELAMDAFTKDTEANYVYNLLVNFTFIIVSISLLVAFLLLEFLIPLLLGNGQTVGKKVFGVAVMREDSVKLSPVLLFIRAILGKYTIETMVPVLIILMIYWGVLGFFGTVILFGMLILQLVLLFSTKERSAIHDKLAHTVAVDYASQKIFDTPEAMLAYKKRIHAEQVASEQY